MLGINLWPSIEEEPGTILKTIPNLSVAKFFTKDTDEDNKVYGNVAVYLNCIAILYLLVHSVYIRRRLYRKDTKLDNLEITPSDFALRGSRLPIDIT